MHTLFVVIVALAVFGAGSYYVLEEEKSAPPPPTPHVKEVPSPQLHEISPAPLVKKEIPSAIQNNKTEKATTTQALSELAPSEGESLATSTPDDIKTASSTPEEITLTIRLTPEGFSPSEIKIVLGTKVIFLNETESSMWPASAIHPSHKSYPGSDIAKCSTPAAASIFDACHEVPPGGSWSFVFTHAGTWKYHDHVAPQNTGVIIVE